MPETEITFYVLSAVRYLDPQPEDPLEPIGWMPVYRTPEAARKADATGATEVLEWTFQRIFEPN